MAALNVLALILTIVGGLNWGLIGIADFNLVTTLFGVGSGITRLVYVLVGLAALYCLILIPYVTRDRMVVAEAP